MCFMHMGNIEQEISAIGRSVQDRTTQEIRKKRVGWCHKVPRRLDYWARIIERWFTKNRSYYWWCGNYDHVLSNLPEEYENIVENLEEKLDDNIDMLTIQIIWDTLSAKYDIMSARSNQTEGKESEKAFYIRQIKGTCYKCGKYLHKAEIVRRENKISIVRPAKNMDMLLKNVTARRSMGKNARTVTRRATKKRSSGRSNIMTKKKRRKRLMPLKRYITTSSFLAMMHSRAKIKQPTRKLSKC